MFPDATPRVDPVALRSVKKQVKVVGSVLGVTLIAGVVIIIFLVFIL